MRKHVTLRKREIALSISALLAGGAAAPVNAQEGADETVVVTGSRIVRRDLTAASPIMTVDAQAFENTSAVSVENVLNQLPQFVPDGDQFGGGIESGPTGSPGAATLNLRGLGSNRNLVLVNSRRAQPVNASLVVDINTIPASAIENVEVITGGASAVYGPDAIAGVTNFILKDDFEGAQFDIQTGETFEGDGRNTRFSALFGMNSADGRGNVMVGVDRTDREEVYQRDRDFYFEGWQDPGTVGGGFIGARAFGAGEVSSNAPDQDVVDSLFPQVAPGTVGRTSNFYFNDDGSVFVAQDALGYNGPLNCWVKEECGAFTGVKVLPSGDLDQTFTEGYLSTPMERTSLFLSGHFDLTDRVTAYTQANYSNIEVKTRGGIPPAITVWQAPIPRDGRALPSDLNALLDSRDMPDADWSLYQVLHYQGGPIEPVNTSNVWQVLVGLQGDIGDGNTTWDLYVSKGDTLIDKVNARLPSLQRYQTLVAAPDFGVGGVTAARGYNIQCDSGLPVFQQFTPDQSCLSGIDSRMIDKSHLTQDIMELNVQGPLVDGWAGEIRYAVGASYRENSFEYNPGNPAGSLIENPIGLFASNATGGDIDVTEFYGELLLPVTSNFELELGYRHSDFSTAGGFDTYKGLFTWQATDGMTLRGGRQVATRAPNIAELFTAPTQDVVFFPQQDPCSSTTLSPWGNVPGNPDRQQVQDLCRTLIGNNTSDFDTQTYSIFGIPGPDGWHRQNPPFFPLAIEVLGGNEALDPEQAETYTLGAVFSGPLGLDRLTLTIDAYEINIKDAIAPLSVVTIYDNCFNRFGTNPTYDVNQEFCQLITRNPVTGDRQQVDAKFANLGILETNGIDVSVSWSMDIGSAGTLAIDSQLNYLDSFKYQTAPGQDIVEAAGTLDQGGLYKRRAFTRFTYVGGDYSLGLTWRYLSDVEDAAYARDPNTNVLGTGAYSEFGFFATYDLDRFNIRVGLDNVFDEDPKNIGGVQPGVDNNAASTNASYYDVLGRTYYAGVSFSF